MPEIAYTVTATCPDGETAEEFIGWLTESHAADVVRAGASSASVLRLEGEDPVLVEVQYLFQGREAYERYIRDAAPHLRAEGVARFPAERGIVLERRVGVVRARIGPGAGAEA